ncbi:MAG TPA: hydrogenase nickel incorporation protein HypB [Candidatus Ratteibacteria bacterium]|nr:hydrogenase nickel incorporation protein HypB [bacterium]HON06110.1 hydrogenase nickel incorporation protein HypB [bacterium]HPC29761.1 hydrogenase nickel incorporation protein HypB [bacterium]HRS07004.1 hydrogenase nickel incorporation protein HypB [Candidatus Ratteibacteria bacterium]HRV04475.1 hydrogenase nickel incorporation protein HypB [Candidatus Ratteibacteria bacterium]
MEIKRIVVKENLFAKNDEIAEENRNILKKHKIFSLNIMGGPGAGKTSILEKTVAGLKNRGISCGVIEGDIAGMFDSERISVFGVPVIQINTGGACHLEAMMVKKGIENLPLDEIKVVFIENVGNLVCPAEFKIGVDCNVTVASITEGEEKPVKYPLMYSISDVVLVNKIDLISVVEFDINRFTAFLDEIKKDIKIIPVSGKTGKNIDDFIQYIVERIL